MKILMVSEDLPGRQVGGLGKHVVTLANALLAHGHQVDILGRSDGGASDIGFHGRCIAGLSLPHPGWKELQLGFFNPLKRPWFARRIAAAIMEHGQGYDAVHYHGHLPMVGLHLHPALNFIQTRHDQGSECLTHLRFRAGQVCSTLIAKDCSGCIAEHAGPLRQALTAVAVRHYRAESAHAARLQKTVFVSEFLRRQFQRALPQADLSRCRVIHNFIDYPSLRAQAGVPAPGQVVMAGRIDVGKGFSEFLAAAAGRLPAGVHISVIGDGPLRASLEARHAGPAVRFAGWQPYPALVAATARSHLCVVPSVCEEACSTTVLEALALGKPCIALARGGTPELAAYQQYDGQLLLGADMDELVALVLRQAALAPVARVLPREFGADAQCVLARLLELYAE
ncbi:MAG: glycosyltransferase family 4 protein [Pseudomonadota bacterium]